MFYNKLVEAISELGHVFCPCLNFGKGDRPLYILARFNLLIARLRVQRKKRTEKYNR